jgi:uncharacterized protein YidB (DUF937 family)
MSSWGSVLGSLAQQVGGSTLGAQIARSLGPAVLGGVLEQLNQNGMGAKVNSWLGRGENQPITPDEIRTALGNETLQQVARSLGVPIEQVTEILAQHLPAAVDHASPNGVLDPSATASGPPA